MQNAINATAPAAGRAGASELMHYAATFNADATSYLNDNSVSSGGPHTGLGKRIQRTKVQISPHLQVTAVSLVLSLTLSRTASRRVSAGHQTDQGSAAHPASSVRTRTAGERKQSADVRTCAVAHGYQVPRHGRVRRHRI